MVLVSGADGAPIQLRDGETILIGIRNSATKSVSLTVRHIKLKFVLSFVDKSDLGPLAELAARIGAVTSKDWLSDTTHVVVGRAESSPKLLRGLLTGKPVVTLQWVQHVAARRTAAEPLPPVADYHPVFDSTLHATRSGSGKSTISQIWAGADLSQTIDRRTCFAGMTLVWERRTPLCELLEEVHRDVLSLSNEEGALVPDIAARIAGSEADWRRTAAAGKRPGVVVRHANSAAVKPLVLQLRAVGFISVPETYIVMAIVQGRTLMQVLDDVGAKDRQESQASQVPADASDLPHSRPQPSGLPALRADVAAIPADASFDIAPPANISRVTSTAAAGRGPGAGGPAGMDVVDLSQDDEIPVRKRTIPTAVKPAAAGAVKASISALAPAVVHSVDISVNDDSESEPRVLLGGSVPAPSDLLLSASVPSQRSTSMRLEARTVTGAGILPAAAKSGLIAPVLTPVVPAAVAQQQIAPGIDISVLRDDAQQQRTPVPETKEVRLRAGVWTAFGRHAREDEALSAAADGVPAAPAPAADDDMDGHNSARVVAARYYEEDIAAAKQLRSTRATAHPTTATAIPPHLKRYYAPPPSDGRADAPTRGKVFRKVAPITYVPVASTLLYGDAVDMIDDVVVAAALDELASELREEQREEDDLFRVAGTAAAKSGRAAAKASQTLAMLSAPAPVARGKRSRMLADADDDDAGDAPDAPRVIDRTPVDIVAATAKHARMATASSAGDSRGTVSRSVQRRAPSASVSRHLPAGAAAVPRIEALAAASMQRLDAPAPAPLPLAAVVTAESQPMPPPPPRPRPATLSVARRR